MKISRSAFQPLILCEPVKLDCKAVQAVLQFLESLCSLHRKEVFPLVLEYPSHYNMPSSPCLQSTLKLLRPKQISSFSPNSFWSFSYRMRQTGVLLLLNVQMYNLLNCAHFFLLFILQTLPNSSGVDKHLPSLVSVFSSPQAPENYLLFSLCIPS